MLSRLRPSIGRLDSNPRASSRIVCVLLLSAGPLLLAQCTAPAPGVVVATDVLLPRPLKACPLVDGALDGKPVPVFLDTGAMCSVMDVNLARRLGFATRAYWIPRTIQLVHGVQHTRHYVEVDTFDLGGVQVHGLELPLLDLAAGADVSSGGVVIGCDVLRQCRILFDPGSDSIRVLAAASSADLQADLRELRPALSWSIVPVHWNGDAPLVDVGVRDRPSVPILLDTGALQSALSTELARRWNLSPMPNDRELVFVDGLRVGPWHARLVAQLLPSAVAERLGFDVMSELLFVWDGPGNQLWIAQPGPGSAGTVDAGFFIDSVLRSMGLEPVRKDSREPGSTPSSPDNGKADLHGSG